MASAGSRRRSLPTKSAPLAVEEEMRDVASRPPPRVRHLSILGGCLVLGFACTLLFMVFGIKEANDPISFQSMHDLTRGGYRLDVPLSPDAHVHRSPTTQYHEWNLTSGYRSPDGVRKRVYLINDEFFGPLIEARSGDTLVVKVRNFMADEGVAMHWHGLHMHGSIEMDGAVGFTQCPIAPGREFTYQFNISEHQHGTFWYHAHDQVQRADGFVGGLVVHRPAEAGQEASTKYEYDEERLLMIGDWYHRSAKDMMDWYMQAASFGMEPVPDSLIINGVGAYNCSLAVPARPIECVETPHEKMPGLRIDASKKYRFRVINIGSFAGVDISFSNAVVHPIEMDGGHAIAGYDARAIGTLHPGERVDFTATWQNSGKTSVDTLNVEMNTTDFKYPNLALATKQSFPVTLVGTDASKTGTAESSEHFSLASVKALVPEEMPATADETLVVYSTTLKLARLSNVPYGFINHTSWKPQETPLMLLPRSQWDENQFVPYIASSSQSPTWVDIVINNLDDGSHPFHLHGYDFFVLGGCADGTYWGSYNPFDAPSGPPCGPYNVANPAKRDTVNVPRRGHVVLRFRANNPGIWLLHCHLLWHQASGMAMGLQVGGDFETGMTGDWSEVRMDAVRKGCAVRRDE